MLPKKWAVLRTADNNKTINAWHCALYGKGDAWDYTQVYFFSDDRGYDFILKPGYKVITFEQFKEEVLGKKPEGNVIINNYSIF